MGSAIEQTQTALDGLDLSRLTLTITIIVILMVMRAVFLSLARRRIEDPATRFRLRRVSGYVVGTLSLIAVVMIWLRGLQPIATFAGLLSAGIAIALKDVMANLAGWLFILWRRPFELGDRIEIAGVRGDVVDIRMFQHSLMEVGNWVDGDDRTGRVLQIPNGLVLNSTVANYTKGWFPHIWDEISFVVTFESNWEKARKLLQDIVGVAAAPTDTNMKPGTTSAYLVMDASVLPAVFLAVGTYGVQLTARYVCDPRQRRATEQRIWEALLKVFAAHDDIRFAYPTQRFYNHAAEGALQPLPTPANGPGVVVTKLP